MKFTLKEYQQTAVSNIKDKVFSFLLYQDNKKRIITFKAPTGSGKTVMMAGVIENLIKENKEDKNIDFTFLWLSIGTGDLHNQSKRSLQKNIGENIKIESIEDVYGTAQYELSKDSVLVSSWNKIRTKDNKTQEWKSIVMKDGDYVNFREMLDNTNSINRKIILIIDESRSHADSGRSNEIIDLIKPNVVIEVSATPAIKLSGEDIVKNNGWIEEIEAQDVIDEQMIKDQILVNSDFVLLKKDDSDQTVLRTAVQKRDELLKIYQENNIDVNPLLLIQLPNSGDGESIKTMVLDFLKKEKNISEGDEKLAIWLNEKDIKERNIEDISKNNGIQDFLIFKQAIAIGWDCPRAQILLKFREIKSEVFEIQVLGRILRTPEQKHYEIESLNKAYVYVNSDEVSFDIENYNPKILGDLPATRKETYKNISLNSFYKERADYQDIKSDFKPVLLKQFTEELGLKIGDYDKNINKLKKDNWKFDRDELYHDVISDIMVEISSIDKYDTPLEDDDYETLNVSDRQIEITSKGLFKSMMAPFTNIARSVPSMNVAWFVLCQNMFGSEIIKDNFVSSQSLLILNRSKIEPIFIRAVEEYSKVKKQKAKEDTEKDVIFDVPGKDYFNSQVVEVVDYKKNILNPCYLDKSRSIPEKEFENVLNNSKKITWWYKNGVNRKDYFGIKYEYDNRDGEDTTHTFYPDYIVQFNDGKIGIFETKSESDQDAHTKTKAKAEELYRYIKTENKKDKNLFGGIVVFKNKEWQINSEKEYSLDGGWKKLEL